MVVGWCVGGQGGADACAGSDGDGYGDAGAVVKMITVVTVVKTGDVRVCV